MNLKSTNSKLLCEKLQSKNNFQILEAVQEVREQGDVSVIPCMLNAYVLSSDAVVQQALADCLCDIKNPEAASFFIDALSNTQYALARVVILQAIWQSGIDYSKYARVFVDILIQDDFTTAIEAFSVLDTVADTLDSSTRKLFCERLMDASKKIASPHKDLLLQMIEILQSDSE